jgi:hypothetical protein
MAGILNGKVALKSGMLGFGAICNKTLHELSIFCT